MTEQGLGGSRLAPSEGWGQSPYGLGRRHFFRLRTFPGADLTLVSSCGTTVLRPGEVRRSLVQPCAKCVKKEGHPDA